MNNIYNNDDDEQKRREQDGQRLFREYPLRVKHSSIGVGKSILIVLGTVFGIFFVAFLVGGFFLRNTSLSSGGQLIEVPLAEECGSETCDPEDLDRVAVIYASGVILEYGASGIFEVFTPPIVSSASVANQLDTFLNDSSVKAIAIQMDSPGGAALPSRELYNAISDASSQKPVYMYINSIGASGGYYAASPSKKIYSNQESLVGSIGAVISRVDCSEAYSESGVTVNTIKSGPLKDIGNPARPMTPEEEQVYQNLIDDSFDRFRDTIISERGENLSEPRFDQIFSGSIFSANQARELGLIDEISSFDNFLDDIIEEERINSNNYQVFTLSKESSSLEKLLGLSTNPEMPTVNHLVTDYIKQNGPEVMYLHNFNAITDSFCT